MEFEFLNYGWFNKLHHRHYKSSISPPSLLLFSITTISTLHNTTSITPISTFSITHLHILQFSFHFPLKKSNSTKLLPPPTPTPSPAPLFYHGRPPPRTPPWGGASPVGPAATIGPSPPLLYSLRVFPCLGIRTHKALKIGVLGEWLSSQKWTCIRIGIV